MMKKGEVTRKVTSPRNNEATRRWLSRLNNGRDGVIRTLDPLHPMQVRYRAALRPDWA